VETLSILLPELPEKNYRDGKTVFLAPVGSQSSIKIQPLSHLLGKIYGERLRDQREQGRLGEGERE
jgi:hypothetical protein